MMNSKFMRIISVLGIIAVLTLQYFWLRNAYGMVERDIMEKSKVCLKESMEEELFQRSENSKMKILVQNDYKLKPGAKIIEKKEIKQGSDITLQLQDCLYSMGNPISNEKVNKLFQKKIKKRIGFIPKYTFRVLDNLSINKDSSKILDEICGTTIFFKFCSKKTIELALTSSITSVITKARYIFVFSLLLVLLIGVILIFQFLNMVRDKDFTAFIKDFSRITVHEMRTPVNSIYMLTSRIMSKEYMDEQRIENYHKESLNLCSKLLLAFDNLLLIAKSEKSKILVQKSQVDLKILLEKIADKYRNNYFLHKTVQITTNYESEDCKAYLDTDLIENTVINLIENAIKYSNESVVISINCSVENKHILLKIKDDGLGIPKNHLKNIFHLFSRGNMKDYKQIKGFGIGLYYVQKVVKAHQGKVSVKSEVGVGSEFVIDIPNRFL